MESETRLPVETAEPRLVRATRPLTCCTLALRGLCPERSTLRTFLPVCQRSKVGLPLFPGRVTQIDADIGNWPTRLHYCQLTLTN